MAPSNIQFVYFNAKGRGEKVRWVLVQSGAKWEDKRMVEGEWATLKPSNLTIILIMYISPIVKDGNDLQFTRGIYIDIIGWLYRSPICDHAEHFMAGRISSSYFEYGDNLIL